MLHCALDNWTPMQILLLTSERLTSEMNVITTQQKECHTLWLIVYLNLLQCGISPKDIFFYLIWGHWPTKLYSPVPSLHVDQIKVNWFSFLIAAGLLFFFFSKQTKKSITCTAPCEVFHTRNSASISLFYLSSQFFLLGTRLWPHKTVGCYWNDLNTVTIKRTSWISNWIASCKGFLCSER